MKSGAAWKLHDFKRQFEQVPTQTVGISSSVDRFSPRGDIVACHFLRETRLSILVSAYFPRIALLLACRIITEKFSTLLPRRRNPRYPSIYFEDANAFEFRRVIRELFRRRLQSGQAIPLRDFMPVVTVTLALALEHHGSDDSQMDWETFKVEELLDEFVRTLKASTERLDQATMSSKAIEFLKVTYKGSFNDGADDFRAAVQMYDNRLRDLYVDTGGGQFAATVLLAGAYEITTDLTWQPATQERNKTIDTALVDLAAERIDRFLERVAYSLRNIAENNRAGAIIQHVFNLMSRHHARKELLPLRLTLLEQSDKDNVSTPIMFDLLMEIIWHLAVIGQPAEMEVLVNCPYIQDKAKTLYQSITQKTLGSEKATNDSAEKVRRIIADVLALGVNRCLIFPLRPAKMPGGAAGSELYYGTRRPFPASEEFPPRYTVHRLVQRYVFAQMGAPDVEYAETNQFTVSLYASQPNDLPRLSPGAHQRVHDVIAALAGYPDDRGGRPFDPTAISARTRVSMLRAAYGIMRSVYSVGVLSRLDLAPQTDIIEASDVGHFEQYRRLIRWLLKSAGDLKTQPGCDWPVDEPFYSEEIVWLYNECGLLSFVQGHIADAHALFGLALKAAREIEPDETRPLHLRIRLNKAVVDIERGRPNEAWQHLKRVEANDDDPVLTYLAKGYLGLIEHLAGNSNDADARYEEAIQNLVKNECSRAAAIFAKHRGDLMRALGDERRPDAQHWIEQSLNFAQEGCHEDVRHMTLLSRANLRIGEKGQGSGEIYSDLDEAERYAQIVGMPRLACEAAALRARLLMEQGETRLATSLAADSLRIAATNNLRIRKMNALLLLTEICMKTRQPHQAKPLLTLASRLAKSSGCHYALTHIQSIESRINFAHVGG